MAVSKFRRALAFLLVAVGSTGIGLMAHAVAPVPGPHQAGEEPRLQVRAVPAHATVAPGDRVPVAVVLDIAQGWHTWTSEAQNRALPPGTARFDGAQLTEIRVTVAPAGAATAYPASIQWPEFHTLMADLGDGPQSFAVYEGRAVAYLPVEIAADAAPGPLEIALEVAYQACNDRTCDFPTTTKTAVALTVAAGVPAVPADPGLFEAFDPAVWSTLGSVTAAPVRFNVFNWEFDLDPSAAAFLPLLLVIAFCGGILLNFTPCVLPIIPLKIMGLSAAAAGERGRTFLLGLAMSGGVVAFWLALGAILSSVTSVTQINEFFQYPLFTIGVGAFIAIMAVAMAGFFSVGLPQWVYAIEPRHETYGGSVIFGVMTAVLSTPCTAPLMGAAAGWAVTTRSPVTILSVFLAIGLGMASPYILLSAFPQMARRMPKTGPASELLKQVMGLLLLAAAAYFIGAGINGYLEDPSKIYWWAVSIIAGCAGLWLAIRAWRLAKSPANRTIFAAIGLVIAALSFAVGPIMTYEPLPWRKYTPAAMETAFRERKVVVLDFTAEWCLTCKALEKTVLESAAVSRVLNGSGVALLKADITGSNEAGSAKLKALGRVTIPLLVVYAPDGREVFKSDTYSPDQVIRAVQEAAQGAERNAGS
jgi:thiol:disulfide interchange protein DsbD